MLAAPMPDNENERLADLLSYNILDTEEENDYNQLVELASLICQCDMSVINFIDLTRQWGKARHGLDDTTAPRSISMCAHTILQDDVMQVQDTLLDERFFDSPFTTEGGIRFYAGAPITSEKGYHIGSLCVCDTRPRVLDEKQVQALKHLTRQAAILLETRKKNKELQRLALSERELKEKAEAAREAQEQFLSTMSHEIRTPLNGVIGMVNILQSESPKPEQKEYLETLQFASKNLLCIVNDVLDYNKISAGHLLLEEVSFDLHLLLQDIRRSHLPNAMKKGIGLFLHLDEALPGTVKADPTRLTQVLNNLVGNAVKFTPEGKVDVVVKPVKVEGNAVTISFSVQDTGIGFEEEKAASLFEQFSQAHVGITRKFGGTGLGLSITKKLLALMGSDIYATSTPGKGSSFSFELTLQTERAGPAAKPADFPEPCHLQNKKVLIADDNAINILVTRKMLQRWEMSTEVAYNGKDALEKIQSGPYDLVLMDAQMPVMDGITTVKQMRARNLFSGPVILLTADAFINAKDEVRSWGFDDYLLKPFTADQLFGKICRLM